LSDYQHVHPQWENETGKFSFSFTPKQAGTYRVFADFMPRATGRSLYAGGDIVVSAGRDALTQVEDFPSRSHKLDASVDGLLFQLSIPEGGIRTNEIADIRLRVKGESGARVVLEEVMGASAHVVAFDEARSGFAHLHPIEKPAQISSDGNSGEGELAFSLFLPDPGGYRLWAQVKLGGRVLTAPFDVDVLAAEN